MPGHAATSPDQVVIHHDDWFVPRAFASAATDRTPVAVARPSPPLRLHGFTKTAGEQGCRGEACVSPTSEGARFTGCQRGPSERYAAGRWTALETGIERGFLLGARAM